MRVRTSSGALSITTSKDPAALRCRVSRWKSVLLPSTTQRTMSFSSWWSLLACAVTRRPVRPRMFSLAWGLLRRKLTACGSAMPRRCSSEAAVSVLRVYSLR